jgi:hypothetical protein
LASEVAHRLSGNGIAHSEIWLRSAPGAMGTLPFWFNVIRLRPQHGHVLPLRSR